MIISLTERELEAAVIACCNYTGAGRGWKQKTQAKAAGKLRLALTRQLYERKNGTRQSRSIRS